MLISFPTKQTERPAFQTFHDFIRLQSRACFQFIDLTDEVRMRVLASGIKHGIVNIQTQHTTAAVVVNEHEPLLLDDLKRTLERLAPRSANYRHDDFEIRTVNLTPGEMILSSPAIAGNKLYVGSYTKGVFCIGENPNGAVAEKAQAWNAMGGT